MRSRDEIASDTIAALERRLEEMTKDRDYWKDSAVTLSRVGGGEAAPTPVCYGIVNAAGRMWMSESCIIEKNDGELWGELEHAQESDPTYRVVPLYASSPYVRGDSWEAKYRWLLHNGGLLNEFAAQWRPAHGTLMAYIEAEVEKAFKESRCISDASPSKEKP